MTVDEALRHIGPFDATEIDRTAIVERLVGMFPLEREIMANRVKMELETFRGIMRVGVAKEVR